MHAPLALPRSCGLSRYEQVLRERVLGADSAFQPYISNLPVGVPGIPIFFPPDAIRALEQYPPLR